MACMSGVEGGHMIEDNLDYLDSFYRRGVRYMTLVLEQQYILVHISDG